MTHNSPVCERMTIQIIEKQRSKYRLNKKEMTKHVKTIAKSMSPAIFVGMKLYREIVRRDSQTEIKEYTVSKIGKRYFYLEENDRYPIGKETMKYEDRVYCHSSFQLYLKKQEILNNREIGVLFDKIRKAFDLPYNRSNYTLEQLREASKILGLY